MYASSHHTLCSRTQVAAQVKACAYIHGVFPYFYIKAPEGDRSITELVRPEEYTTYVAHYAHLHAYMHHALRRVDFVEVRRNVVSFDSLAVGLCTIVFIAILRCRALSNFLKLSDDFQHFNSFFNRMPTLDILGFLSAARSTKPLPWQSAALQREVTMVAVVVVAVVAVGLRTTPATLHADMCSVLRLCERRISTDTMHTRRIF